MTTALRLSKLQTALRRHRKLIVFGFVMFGLLLFQFVQAQTAGELASIVSTGATNPFWLLIMGMATIFNVINWGIGQFIVLTISMIIIPILGYNGFADSHVVNIGWPLVRDVINMFVIIILLYIAIMKMIAPSKIQFDQALVRLFVGVVALNFSRTICVLAIDASQVVMFTFVNALQDIAAGNFVGLFNINSFMSLSGENITEGLSNISSDIAATTGNDGMNAIGYAAQTYLTTVLLMMVLVTLLIIGIVFIYRIVVLWVLMITSPVAFFFMALGGLVPGIGGVSKQWSTRFTGAVLLGPILTFFLWLSLAAAGGGSIADVEGFETGDTAGVTSLATEAFEVEAILSLFIAIVLLMVGLNVAQGSASQLGSFAAAGLKKGEGFAKTALTLPARGTTATVGSLGRSIESRTGVLGSTARGLSTDAQRFLGGPNANFASRLLNRGVQTGLGRATQYSSRVKKEEQQKASETYKGLSSPEKAEIFAAIERGDLGDQAMTEGRRRSFQEAIYDIRTNKSSRKEQMQAFVTEERANGRSEDEAKEIAQQRMDALLKNATQATSDDALRDNIVSVDDKRKEALKKADVSDAHLVDAKTRQKLFEADDFDPKQLSKEALRDAGVQSDLRGRMVSVKDKDGNYQQKSMLSLIAQGHYGAPMQKKLTEKEAIDFATASAETLGPALRNGGVGVEDIKPSDIQVPGTTTPDAAKVKTLAKALAQSGVGLGGIDPTVLTEVRSVLPQLRQDVKNVMNDATKSRTERSAAKREYRVLTSLDFATTDSASDPVGSVLGVVGGSYTGESRGVVQQIIRDRPEEVHKFSGEVGSANQFTQEVLSNASEKHAKQLRKLAEDALGAAERDNVKKSAKVIVDALKEELSAATTAGNTEEEKRIRKLVGQYRSAANY